MSNHIEQIRIVTRKLTPTDAELHVHVRPREMSPTAEVRGRLMGPRCLFSTTIEIAYPLRKLAGGNDAGLMARALIPEPNWWHPEAPFLYEGPIELWDDGKCCDRQIVRCGLRSVEWKDNAISWNGKPLTVRGTNVENLDGEKAPELRRKHYNAVLIERALTDDTLRNADMYGLLVFQCATAGQIRKTDELTYSPSWMGCISIDA